MRKPRPPGLPALPLRQLERQRQLAVIAGEDQRWAIRLRMQEIELYRGDRLQLRQLCRHPLNQGIGRAHDGGRHEEGQ